MSHFTSLIPESGIIHKKVDLDFLGEPFRVLKEKEDGS
jgi:hypothetical protein